MCTYRFNFADRTPPRRKIETPHALDQTPYNHASHRPCKEKKTCVYPIKIETDPQVDRLAARKLRRLGGRRPRRPAAESPSWSAPSPPCTHPSSAWLFLITSSLRRIPSPHGSIIALVDDDLAARQQRRLPSWRPCYRVPTLKWVAVPPSLPHCGQAVGSLHLFRHPMHHGRIHLLDLIFREHPINVLLVPS